MNGNKTIWTSFKEFLCMWLASLSPIILGSLFIKIGNSNLKYFEIIVNSIEVDIIFAYVATMISPFLYMLSKYLSDANFRKDLKKIRYAGVCILISIFVAITVTSIFSVEKKEDVSLHQSEVSSSGEKLEIQDGKLFEFLVDHSWIELSFANRLLLICYVLSLLIWFYTIYLNNVEPRNIVNEGRERVSKLMDDVNDVVEAS